MTNLFQAAGLENDAPRPLADRLRPQSLKDVVGQDHLVAPTAPIGRMAAEGRLTSMILWGPPGTGKTTVARLLALHTAYPFEQVSAVFTGVADLRKVFEAAALRRQAGQGTLLFVDEIHRFNRSQQDSFLPYMEDGTVVLVGATTENPSFELNAALLSRAQVFVLQRLDTEALGVLISRAEQSAGKQLPVSAQARITLCAMADGDGRYLLSLCEQLLALDTEKEVDTPQLVKVLRHRAPMYDKSREEHYNLVSALHKSVRGSDPDAALYWLARMLIGGEDPLYILRRLTRAAMEDVGLADPRALEQAIAAKDAYEFLGSPEGEIALVQLTIYLSCAPKSNAAYLAESASKRAAREHGSVMPPAHILNAPTRLMKDLGYGQGYAYDHAADGRVSGQNYFPPEIQRQSFYQPTDQGLEQRIAERMTRWAAIRARMAKEQTGQ